MIPQQEFQNIIIVYHHNCMDGTAGGWVIKHYFENIKNIPRERIHMIGQQPQCPELLKYLSQQRIDLRTTEQGYNIIFVDICPSIGLLKKLVGYNQTNGYKNRIEIYDHHQTNQNIFTDFRHELEGFVKYEFDMTRCGCQIAWDAFYEGQSRPMFINYIGQGDLWHFESNESKLLYSILCENFKSFEKLDWLYYQTDNYFTTESSGGIRREYLDEAYIINKYKQSVIDKFKASAKKNIFKYETRNSEGVINNKLYNVWFIQCNNYDIVSELGNQLCDKPINSNTDTDTEHIYPDFVVIVKDFEITERKAIKFNISLRSNASYKPDINVANIAKKYGGGGHQQAAGCSILSTEFTKIIM